MLLHIDDTSTVRDVQAEFNTCFPYLRIEFVEAKNDSGGRTQTRYLTADTLVLTAHCALHPCVVDVDPLMTVRQFESLLEATLGIDVEVYRQSGQTWLRTLMTHDWSLQYQNEQGEILSTQSAKETVRSG